MLNKRLNEQGFTLLEVLVAVAIVAVLAGVGAFYANRYLPVYRLREATRDMASTLQDARLESIKRGSPCVVSFGTNGFDYISFVDINQDFVFNGADIQLDSKLLANYQYVFWGKDPDGDGVDDGVADPLATAVSFGGNTSVGFNNRGMSIILGGGLAMGSIQLENTQSRVRQIVVNAAGNVRML